MRPSVLQGQGLRPASSLVDEYLETYVSWREAAYAVQSAYEHWHAVREPDDVLAFAAYRAALDREERAATLLREAADRVAAADG